MGAEHPHLSMSFMAKITHRSRGEPFKELKDAFIPSIACSNMSRMGGHRG
jgi:hypothetical protein